MANNRVELSLKNFFIYNVSFGQKEGEEEKKILWYFPSGANIDIQIKNVGLSEAIVKFSSTFSKDPCESLCTEKTVRLFYEPEPNFWMVLTVNCPAIKKGKDGADGTDYRGCEVKPTVYQGVLKQAYAAARLIIGPFQDAINSDPSGAHLRHRLNTFFTRYMFSMGVKQAGMPEAFGGGLKFLPLATGAFLAAQSFVNSVEASIKAVEHTLLIHKNLLVWSGLTAEDTRTLYRYLVDSLVPTVLSERSASNIGSGFLTSHLCPDDSLFVCGPRNVNDVAFSGRRLPKVWLDSGRPPGFRSLIVYRFGNTDICWLVAGEESVSMEMYRSLEYAVRQVIPSLTAEMSAAASEALNSENDYAFLYHNSTNLALKATLPSHPADLLPLLVDVHDAHSKCIGTLGSCETIAKTVGDHWVVGRSSNSRHLFITTNRPKSLVDVNTEVNKICKTQLKNIYFHL